MPEHSRRILRSMMTEEAAEAMKNAEKTQLALVQEGLSMQRNRRRVKQFP
jgi:hypothetical protein